jgi:hypothetical protein
MNIVRLPRALCAAVGTLALAVIIRAAEPLPDRPDPREIPLPKIKTDLGDLPGVDQLPVRKEMPEALMMNDGTKVTTVEQMKKRQQEMRTILEYYHVGRMPPAPGNVKGTVTKSENVEIDGKVKYRYCLVHLTFGPDEKLFMDVGIVAPAEGGPFPTVIQFGGPAPGAAPRERLPSGPIEGRGADILLPPEIALAGAQNAARGGAGARGPGARGPGPRGGPNAGGASAAAEGVQGSALPGGAVAGGPGAVGAGRGPAGRGRGGPGGFGGFGGGNTAAGFAARFAQVLDHGYAVVSLNTNDCAEDTTLRMPDGSFAFRTTRFFPAYPGYDWGIIGGWVWGAMRVVDYLQTDTVVDKTKLIITGVSRNGKAAMIAGAFDDRIAMVAPGASSGLGTPAYRFSGGATTSHPSRGGKEGLTMMVRKYGNQFSPNLHQFWGQEEKLPYDAHWFPALTAPRPFIMLEGTHDQNVVHNGIKQTYLAAQSSYALFGDGMTDKLGVYWADRPHGFGDTDWDGLLAFADKHLLGKRVTRAFDLFPADTEATANQ